MSVEEEKKKVAKDRAAYDNKQAKERNEVATKLNKAKADLEGIEESREIQAKGCDKCKRCPATSEGEWRPCTNGGARTESSK